MLGILLGLLVLVLLCYKGYNIIWVAPVAALVVAVTGGLDLLPAYTETYMSGLVGFVKSWFPIFIMGAIFGKLMEATGAAKAVARFLADLIGYKRAILAVVIACAVLTYGGVSLFVVVFAIYPMAIELFKEADISKRLIPGAIALGSFTFTMTGLPGSPQLNNLIAAKYLGTSTMAAPILGLVSSVIMLGLGYVWLTYREKKLRLAGEHFQLSKGEVINSDDSNKSHWLLGIVPLIVVICTLNILQWNALLAIGSGILLTALFHITQWRKFMGVLNSGAEGSAIAIINTAAAVGFGTVVRSVSGFAALTAMLLGMGGNPLLSEAVAITLLAGATGSSSGGMTIALEALATKYLEVAHASGISPEAFHRIATVASGGLDTLPHCGAVITLLAVCKLTHKDSYLDIGVVCCVIPLIAVSVIVFLGSFGII